MGKTYRRNRSDWDDYEDFGDKKNRSLEDRRQNKKRKLDVRFSEMYSGDSEEQSDGE